MCLNNLSGTELVALASIISIYISNELSADEIDTLGNFFSALGANLSTISSASQSTSSNENNKSMLNF